MADDTTIVLDDFESSNAHYGFHNIRARLHFSLWTKDENRLKLELHPAVLNLIQYYVRLLNQRIFVQFSMTLAAELYRIFESHGVALSIWSDQFPDVFRINLNHRILSAAQDISNLFPAVYCGNTQMNVVKLIEELAKFEEKLARFRIHVKKYVKDRILNSETSDYFFSFQSRPVILQYASELVERHDWNKLGYMCGRIPMLRTSVKRIRLNAVHGNYLDPERSFFVLPVEDIKQLPFSPIYFETFLQRVVCDKEITNAHKCEVIATITQLLTRTFDRSGLDARILASLEVGEWMREEILICCVAISTCIALHELEGALKIVKSMSRLQNRMKTAKLKPYSVAFTQFVRYLEMMERNERCAEDFMKMGEELLIVNR